FRKPTRVREQGKRGELFLTKKNQTKGASKNTYKILCTVYFKFYTTIWTRPY
ncbi:unnamed protein product, partial [Sphagnum troendelagicum]